jgi:hypothetical protein
MAVWCFKLGLKHNYVLATHTWEDMWPGIRAHITPAESVDLGTDTAIHNGQDPIYSMTEIDPD